MTWEGGWARCAAQGQRGKQESGWLITSNWVDIGSGTLPRTWSGWQSRDLLIVVIVARKGLFCRSGQVMLRKLGFVETNWAQDSTSRKLLCAFGLFSLCGSRILALHVCYQGWSGQRDLEKQQQPPPRFPWHFRKKAYSGVCFFPTPEGTSSLEADLP